jgi:hypothetical protein
MNFFVVVEVVKFPVLHPKKQKSNAITENPVGEKI